MLEALAFALVVNFGVWLGLATLPSEYKGESPRQKRRREQRAAKEAERRRPWAKKDWVTVAWLVAALATLAGGMIAAGAYWFAWLIIVAALALCLKPAIDRRQPTAAAPPSPLP
jgi:hypothetical protein